MNFEDQIAYGHFSLAQLSQLIDENTAQAKTLNVKLTWGFTQGKIYGRVLDETNKIFEKYYHGKHTHMHIAQMHLHFSQFLSRLAIQRRPAARSKGASASGMTIGEKASQFGNV